MHPASYSRTLALFAAAVFVVCFAGCTVDTPAEPPNIVFLLVDDLGAMDIGAFNPDTFYETPNIDRLAAGGVRFTRGYAANPVCSPTRFSIMTGRYPTRVGATNYFAGRREEKFAPAPLNDRMPLEQVTLAEALRDGGYNTAFLGKWHLGPTEEFWPLAQGFDVNVGGHRGGMPRSYFSPYSNPTLSDGPQDEHLTARLTDEALTLLDGYAADEEGTPFLLYLSYYTVHTPLRAPADLIAKYAAKAGVEVSVSAAPPGRASAYPADPADFGEEEQVWPRDEPRRVREVQNHAVYAAMVEILDTSVGRILDRLDALDLAKNTIVVFFSDNGGLSTAEGSPTSNLPLRGGKGWLYEGGIREPMIVRWPAVAAAGGVTAAPVISTDFYPTLLEAAGVDLPLQIEIDGSSFLDLLRGGEAGENAAATASERDLFWHYPHYANQGGFPGGAIARGRYKLIERYEDGQVHLYDLDADVGERNDLAAEQPERVAEMRARLHAWYGEVGAEFLSALPDGPEPWQPQVRSPSGPPPNIVFLLVDDLGVMDVGAFNPDTFYETPNIDRLAAGGVRFNRGYAANPVCSPTRFSIMTGRYPTRVGATNWFSGRRVESFAPAPLKDWMPVEEYTLAEALRDGGYSTAFLGKWHLGPTEEFWPEAQGFDVNVGGYVRGRPSSYFSPYSNPRLEDGPEGEYLTERLTDEALDLLDGYAADEDGRPFLLYLSYYTVHTPLEAPADLIAKYAAKAGVEAGAPVNPDNLGFEEQIWPRDEPRRVQEVQNHPVYAAMVESLDASVGLILDRLEALDLVENTIVVFFSDNGGLSTSEMLPTSNLPLRGGKGWLYEGGIREPMIVRWPAVAPAGGVTEAPVISTDFYPTLLEAAGIDPSPEVEIDGVSFLDLLRGGEVAETATASAGERDLFWHYPHYGHQGGFPGGGIARGRYKLLERYEDGEVHLYDLEADEGERNDLAAEQPDRVAEMRARLHAWYEVVGAQFLSALPDGPEPWRPAVASAGQ